MKFKNPTIQAIDDLLVTNVDLGRKLLRTHVASTKSGSTASQFELKVKTHVTRLEEGNKYRKIEFKSGDKFFIRSLYVGKKGDVIFTFSGNASAETNEFGVIITKCVIQYEMKMTDAIENLSGFEDFLSRLFSECIEERKAHYEKMQKQAEISKQKAIDELIAAERERQAQKYAGNIARGAW